MNIIFLDIDGVLNTKRYRDIQVKYDGINEEEAKFNFDPKCMKFLKKIVEETNAYIVISSTWKYDKEKDDDLYWLNLIGNLNIYKLKDRVIDCTPDLRAELRTFNCRSAEIEKWLTLNNGKVNNFVIIDDDYNINECIINHLAPCEEQYGFNEDVYMIAKKILNNEYVENISSLLYDYNIF